MNKLLIDYLDELGLNRGVSEDVWSIRVPVDGTTRSGLKKGDEEIPQSIVMEALFDLNLKVLGYEISSDGRIGVAVGLNSIAYENKKALEHRNCLSASLESFWSAFEHRGETAVFVEYQADLENDTIASAGIKMYEAVAKLGLVSQDVLYGNIDVDDAVRFYETTDKGELLACLRDGYPSRIIRDGKVWENEELYIKHRYYMAKKDMLNGKSPKPFTISGVSEDVMLNALGDWGI